MTVTIDGVNYSRMIETNGKPLSRKKQIAEQQRSESTGRLGKDYDFVLQVMNRAPRDYIYSDLPISYLDTLFENRVVGRQLIDGRDNFVIESVPKTGAKPGNERERTALDWKETTWIDLEDEMPTQYDAELLNRKDYLLIGTTESIEFTRLPVTHPGKAQQPPNVWLIKSDSGHFLWRASNEICKDAYYNYRRFQSDAHVLEDSVRQVPAPASSKQP